MPISALTHLGLLRAMLGKWLFCNSFHQNHCQAPNKPMFVEIFTNRKIASKIEQEQNTNKWKIVLGWRWWSLACWLRCSNPTRGYLGSSLSPGSCPASCKHRPWEVVVVVVVVRLLLLGGRLGLSAWLPALSSWAPDGHLGSEPKEG